MPCHRLFWVSEWGQSTPIHISHPIVINGVWSTVAPDLSGLDPGQALDFNVNIGWIPLPKHEMRSTEYISVFDEGGI